MNLTPLISNIQAVRQRLGIKHMAIRTHKRFQTEHVIPDRLDFVGLYYDEKGYRLHVAEFASEDDTTLELCFESSPLAQRSMDEGSFLSITWAADEINGPVGPIVIVTGSDFLEWFHEQSCGIYSVNEVMHVAVLTQNEWVEVLCLSLPILRKTVGKKQKIK